MVSILVEMPKKKTDNTSSIKQDQEVDLKAIAIKQKLQNQIFKKMIEHLSNNPIKKES